MAKKRAPKKKRVTAIPSDFAAVSAHLTVQSVAKSLAFYQKAFGFKLVGAPMKMGGKIIHAVLKYRDCNIMLGPPSMDGSGLMDTPNALKLKSQAFGLFVYVGNVNKHHAQVKRFKLPKITEPMDQFWGDRTYEVVDRDGHHWTFASRKSMPTPDEMKAKLAAMTGK